MKTIFCFLFIIFISLGFLSCEVESTDDEISNLELVQIDKEDAGAIGDRGKK